VGHFWVEINSTPSGCHLLFRSRQVPLGLSHLIGPFLVVGLKGYKALKGYQMQLSICLKYSYAVESAVCKQTLAKDSFWPSYL